VRVDARVGAKGHPRTGQPRLAEVLSLKPSDLAFFFRDRRHVERPGVPDAPGDGLAAGISSANR